MRVPTKLCFWIALFLGSVLPPAVALAQTDCEEGNGPLRKDQPQSVAPAQLVQKFAVRESVFKVAHDNYTYTQDITVQTLDGHTVDGEFREVSEISYDNKGNAVRTVTFAPQSTLTRVSMSKEDFDDIRNKMLFVLTTQDLPQYDVLYVGIQHVDEIDTYVFDVAPKHIESDKRYFQGRVWVDDHDFQIVKSCGKTVPDIRSKNKVNLAPRFVTYREQIDGQYWFPTYSRADDFLHFANQDVHIREIIKYTDYKRWGSRTKIIFRGEAAKDQPK